jgi:hypothetical protein
MATQQPWYVSQRGRSLAYIFLTNEPGIAVVEERGVDFGIDYKLVLNPGDPGDNEWVGVKVKATERDPKEAVAWDPRGLSKPYFEKMGVPIFLLVVNARDERCFFGWIKEPVVPGETQCLRSHTASTDLPVKPIDRGGYHEQVIRCREFFERQKSGTGNGRHRP